VTEVVVAAASTTGRPGYGESAVGPGATGAVATSTGAATTAAAGAGAPPAAGLDHGLGGPGRGVGARADGLEHLGVGGEDHEHLAPFHAGRRLDHRHLLQVLDDLLQHLLAELAVGHLAAAEHDGDAGLVGLLEELADLLDLDVVVVLLGAGTELDLLEEHHHLVLLGLVLLLLLQVLELPVVHDLADGRLGERADLDEVHPLLLGPGQRLVDAQDAELLARRTDHPHLPRLDPAVGARVTVGPLIPLIQTWLLGDVPCRPWRDAPGRPEKKA
jgi:hypothetical protein